MRRLSFLAAFLATPAAADPITVTKTVTAVSDPLGNLAPRLLPGAVADYRTTATNPLGNTLNAVRRLVLTETLPPDVILRVTDLAAAGKGPVDFMDVNVLGTGLLATGLSLTYSASAPTTDGVEFFDGTNWTYQPVADANGYDARVRAVRLTLTGTFSAGTSFQLRYRVTIR